jgi:hypothetical protein
MSNELLTLSLGDEKVILTVEMTRYEHGDGLAVQLFDALDHEYWATVSLNLEGVSLPSDEFVFKTYSENEGLLEAMLAADFVELTGKSTNVGPICRLLKHSGGPARSE